MKRIASLLPLTLLIATTTLLGQSSRTSHRLIANQSGGGTSRTATAASTKSAKIAATSLKPLARVAFGGGISLMGVNMQMATNLDKHTNLRVYGNFFNYTENNITVSNFDMNAKMNFATAGVSMDYYPFPRHGLRLSPGVMLYNQNKISANAIGATGSNIKLDGQEYYSETSDPLTVNGSLGLNTNKQAFTLTTGWGNMIPRKGGHWSFPFELGAAFTGTPTVNLALGGSACTTESDAATSGASCVPMASDSTAQANLTAQIAKWKNDLNPLKVYPIFSFGISYAFHIR